MKSGPKAIRNQLLHSEVSFVLNILSGKNVTQAAIDHVKIADSNLLKTATEKRKHRLEHKKTATKEQKRR